jgi:hypothetical protein
MDRVRRLLVALVVLVAAGLVALMVTVRPGLRDDADAVDTTWRPIVTQLGERYAALEGVKNALDKAGLGDRDVTVALGRTLDRWKVASTGTDTDEQVETAGQLEMIAARATALADRPRLRLQNDLKLSLAAFTAKQPPAPLVARYNSAVTRYQDARDGVLSRIVASLDGYPMRPTLQLLTA